jgi:hypothetical protein
VITNVLDCRGDHSAIDPIDAMVVSYALEGEERGVALARPNIREGMVREDITIKDALAWAQALPRGVVLILFDGTSARSRLADARSSDRDDMRRALMELGIRIPLGGMRFERGEDMLALLADALVPPKKPRRRRRKCRSQRVC